MRQIVLDTETTGLEPKEGHRIIEIGAVELVNRKITGNNYHQYIQPDREIDAGAMEVHGITPEFLADKPRFGEIASEFLAYIQGAELIIHNAPFDVGFINHEFAMLGPKWGRVEDHCQILDTLAMARNLHPGQKNSLDALCKRYNINNAHRTLHGALLDSEILADVYLAMTGGQVSLSLSSHGGADESRAGSEIRRIDSERPVLKVIKANDEELARHEDRLQAIDKASDGQCIWLNLH